MAFYPSRGCLILIVMNKHTIGVCLSMTIGGVFMQEVKRRLHSAAVNCMIASRNGVTTRTYCYARQDMEDDINEAVSLIEKRIQKNELKAGMMVFAAMSSSVLASFLTYILMK